MKYPKTCHSLFAFGELLIQRLKSTHRFGTAQNYAKALGSLRNFLLADSPSSDDLLVEMLDKATVARYNCNLVSRGVSRNTIGYYNRTLKTIYNHAVEELHLPDAKPFAGVYAGVAVTRSRAVSSRDIRALMNLDLSSNPRLALARDLFLFSFLTRGMAFVDMAYLRRSDISGGFISYSRKKTGTAIRVRLVPMMAEIIARYSPETRGTVLVFPLIRGDSPESRYLSYQTALAEHNRSLKVLSSMISCPHTLSSYVPRHSWATIARNLGIPLSVISEGMGHGSEKMTRVYLGEFDSRVIDRANSEIIGSLGTCDFVK